MSHKIDFARFLEFALLAGVGGFVRFIADRMHLPAISRGKFILLGLANGLVSAFTGLMGALFVSTLTHDHTWHIISAGVFGYYGTKGFERVSNLGISFLESYFISRKK